MPKTHPTVRLGWIAAALIALLAALPALLAPLPALAEQPQDAWITTRVKIALLTDERIDAVDVDVDTFDGRVTLHGSVPSTELQQHAAGLASGVEGVREVRNLLAVVPESARQEVQASDEQIRERVAGVLERDAALAKSDIEVESVNGGIVVLAGDAESLTAHRRALEDARSVEGVRSVASEIRSPDELADREIWSEVGPGETGGLEPTLGDAASDTWITTRAKLRLMAEPGMSALSVNVDTRDGVVTLFGSVPTEEKRGAAEREVREISGVKAVENELQVVPDVAAEQVGQRDDQLREAVRQRLEQHESLRDDEIGVEVSNAVVRLTGTVNQFSDKLRALTVARGTEGVDSIVDDLHVPAASES